MRVCVHLSVSVGFLTSVMFSVLEVGSVDNL